MAIKLSKVCYECNNKKPLTEYYKDDIYCKYCRVGRSLKSHLSKTKKRKCTYEQCNDGHYAKGYCRTHYSRVVRNNTPKRLTEVSSEYDWAYNLTRKYQITPGVFKDKSKNGCNVCKTKQSGQGRRLQIDHDHTYQGEEPIPKEYLRGVVCHQCNSALGKYDNGLLRSDNPLYPKIVKYIKRYEKRNSNAKRLISKNI